MNMDPDYKVIFKEKTEEKGIKSKGSTDSATIRFDFRASTWVTPARGQEAEGPATEDRNKDPKRVELNKFSCSQRSSTARATSRDGSTSSRNTPP